MKAETGRSAGSYQEWDSAWQTLPAARRQLYTASGPQTLLQFWQRCYFEDLWKAMGRGAGTARYLEAGSGRGTTSMYLANRNCSVTMVDLSPNAFRLARANFEQEGLTSPTMVQADARSTGLPGGSFDCVFSIGLLEHFDDPRPVLAEALRLLVPGGLLFMVIVPDRSDGIKWLVRMLFCPWRLLRYGLGMVRRKLTRNYNSAAHDAGMLRTAHDRSAYEEWARELGGIEIGCVPYNPYHSVYRNDRLDESIILPVYRLHHWLRTKFSERMALRTWAPLAVCDLLTCRKASHSQGNLKDSCT